MINERTSRLEQRTGLEKNNKRYVSELINIRRERPCGKERGKADKEDRTKIAVVDPDRIDRYNTSNVSRGNSGTQLLTSPFRRIVVYLRTRTRNTIQKLKVDWIAPARCREWIHVDCVCELEFRTTMDSMKRIIIVRFLSPLFRLPHLCLFLRPPTFSPRRLSAPSLRTSMRRSDVYSPVPLACTTTSRDEISLMQLYICERIRSVIY